MSSASTLPPNLTLTGETFLAGRLVPGTGKAFQAYDPVQGTEIGPLFSESSLDQVDEACQAAAACFDDFRSRPRAERAQFLEAIAAEILALGDALLERAMQETGLPLPRLQGEQARTVSQLQLFASVVREGRFLEELRDEALPARQPLPRPELLLRRIPIGPVAVFGASNFPLAFSVAGGDSASALAAGCPVVVKAHPSHPGTSELVARAVQSAVRKSKLPDGIFSMLQGAGNEVGGALATHPAITAVAFTGSRKGGLALMQMASQRSVPIPVFAEMSSVNPVFVFPQALAARGSSIATGYVDSLTLGTGQFCTQPGLLFLPEGAGREPFLEAVEQALQAKAATPMLNRGIYVAYQASLQQLKALGTITLVSEGNEAASGGLCGRSALFRTSFEKFQQHPELQDEVFGPSSIVVLCEDTEAMLHAAQMLEGQLTATLQLDPGDYEAARAFVPVLERKAGRLLANGFPTGVEVAHAMVHGGPFPATSDSRFTSVGTQALQRFLRPVCYQNMSPDLLFSE